MAPKLPIVMASFLAVSLTLTACSKHDHDTAHHATEDIAAEQGEIARANNPPPQAKEPATPIASVAAPTAPKNETATANDGSVGEKLYNTTCKTCHDTGVLGAPKTGDKANWAPRIAQGKDILYKHAIEGFTGKSGTMPPKGTSTAPDADIKAAVDYMVQKNS
ncbi:cytochrome c-type protein [Moraxella macacae 0408225]|uniref:Cytochrome c-type protein n=1 Tax=Moraxella macacae 0408225 TaxID=1230338 RepID=L2F8A9_9GAMM|nr:c-type cytochrome [Moraxella macacae]ELA09120.1 cytochrome c-type protein [Moraxella macacae 0408225]